MTEIAEFCGLVENISVTAIQEGHELLVLGGGSANHYVSVDMGFANGDGQALNVRFSAHRDDDSLSRVFTGTGLKSYRLTLEEV